MGNKYWYELKLANKRSNGDWFFCRWFQKNMIDRVRTWRRRADVLKLKGLLKFLRNLPARSASRSCQLNSQLISDLVWRKYQGVVTLDVNGQPLSGSDPAARGAAKLEGIQRGMAVSGRVEHESAEEMSPMVKTSISLGTSAQLKQSKQFCYKDTFQSAPQNLPSAPVSRDRQ